MGFPEKAPRKGPVTVRCYAGSNVSLTTLLGSVRHGDQVGEMGTGLTRRVALGGTYDLDDLDLAQTIAHGPYQSAVSCRVLW